MRNGLIVTTSALNPDNRTKAMEPFLKEGKDLLVIAVSSGISTTYQSAMIVAADLREAYPQRVIQVVDWVMACAGAACMEGAVYATQGYGFLCMPRYITDRLVFNDRTFDEVDAWQDIWCLTTYGDRGKEFSFLDTTVQERFIRWQKDTQKN